MSTDRWGLPSRSRLTADSCPPREKGFTLFELMLATALVGLASAGAAVAFRPVVSLCSLLLTREVVVSNMRVCQQESVTENVPWSVRLSMYTPEFSTYRGPAKTGHYLFEPGVSYKDGYLQMQTGRISYNGQGISTTAGVVRLVSGGFERDIRLYMNSGVQSEDDAR